MTLRGKLFKTAAEAFLTGTRKVTVIGAGSVGTAIVGCLLTQGVTNEICLIDKNVEKTKGEINDFQQASNLINHARLSSSTDFADSYCSSLGIVAVGGRPTKDLKGPELMKTNAAIINDIVPKFVEHSPESLILIITHPVDVMTYLAWKASGWPAHRVIGTGTSIDSNRLRVLMAERLGLAPSSIDGVVIGEHGKSAVTCWSSISIGGSMVSDIYPELGKPNDPDKWHEIHTKILQAGDEIIALKGGTWWGVALAASNISRLILDNSSHICPVTTNVNGMHDIQEDIFMSLPCVLGLNGVQQIVSQNLSEEEKKGLKTSAEILLKLQKEADCL